MKLLLDTADLAAIERLYGYYAIDGVTTNPSILARSGCQPFQRLKAIRSFIGADADLHVQVVARDAAGMVADAHRIIQELGAATYVKIPCLPEGFKAMQQLQKEHIPITGTAVYAPMQAFLAAKAGASFIAPYVNRIDNFGYDGIAVTEQIHDILTVNHLPAQVLAASFKNSQQVLALCQYGIGAATAAPAVIDSFVKNPAISAAVDDFIKDFESLAGTGQTMADL
jgi:fructose-6-phosphate aldolase 2